MEKQCIERQKIIILFVNSSILNKAKFCDLELKLVR